MGWDHIAKWEFTNTCWYISENLTSFRGEFCKQQHFNPTALVRSHLAHWSLQRSRRKGNIQNQIGAFCRGWSAVEFYKHQPNMYISQKRLYLCKYAAWQEQQFICHPCGWFVARRNQVLNAVTKWGQSSKFRVEKLRHCCNNTWASDMGSVEIILRNVSSSSRYSDLWFGNIEESALSLHTIRTGSQSFTSFILTCKQTLKLINHLCYSLRISQQEIFVEPSKHR